MAHFARKQLMTLLGLLSSGHIDEDAIHDTTDDTCIVPLTSRRDPPNLVSYHDAKVDLVGTRNSACGREGGAHSIAIGGMDVRG